MQTQFSNKKKQVYTYHEAVDSNREITEIQGYLDCFAMLAVLGTWLTDTC